MRAIVIYGNGDQARTAFMYLSKDSPYRVAAFTTTAKHIDQSQLFDLPVVPFEQVKQSHPPDNYDMFVAIGFKNANKLRADKYDECRTLGYKLISYICSRVSQWGDIKHGENCFVAELVGLPAFVELGNNVWISSGTVIGHDVRIGNHVFVGPGAMITGRITIGERSFIGANATLRNGITIADQCVIGAGATIMHDTNPKQAIVAPSSRVVPAKSDTLAPFIGRRRSDD